ncbi:MAG: hypothetical protein H0U92_05255 [Actinobacteria bacterium]|nr:hypothetical protein [Actinomycetota bacterium]
MKTKFLAAALVAVALVITPTAALAQTRERPAASEERIDRVKARCLAQIDRRQRALEAEANRLDQARGLSAEHKSALKQINTQVSDGLEALAAEIQGEDNAEELRAECRRIVEGFRVFTLVRPRTRVVIASDRELAAVARLGSVAKRIQAAIDKAKADGRDTAEAEQHLASMRSATDAAAGKAGGVYDDVIGLTAADYNANHDVLKPSIAAVRDARNSIRTAISEARAARDALKAE